MTNFDSNNKCSDRKQTKQNKAKTKNKQIPTIRLSAVTENNPNKTKQKQSKNRKKAKTKTNKFQQ